MASIIVIGSRFNANCTKEPPCTSAELNPSSFSINTHAYLKTPIEKQNVKNYVTSFWPTGETIFKNQRSKWNFIYCKARTINNDLESLRKVLVLATANRHLKSKCVFLWFCPDPRHGSLIKRLMDQFHGLLDATNVSELPNEESS